MFQNLTENQVNELQDKTYRDAYMREVVLCGIPYQIRAMRTQRQMTQEDVAGLAGKKQGWIAELERADKTSYTLSTLMQIAAAFDVGLVVKFVPYERFLEEYDDVSPPALEAQKFSFSRLSRLARRAPRSPHKDVSGGIQYGRKTPVYRDLPTPNPDAFAFIYGQPGFEAPTTASSPIVYTGGQR